MRELWWCVIKFIELLGRHEYVGCSFTAARLHVHSGWWWNMASQRMEPQQLFLPEPGVSHNMIAPSAGPLSERPHLHSSNTLINKQQINDLREGTEQQALKKMAAVHFNHWCC